MALSEAEKLLLVQLMLTHGKVKNYHENTLTASWQRLMEWKAITRDFNKFTSGTPRNQIELQDAWDNIKQGKKTFFIALKRDIAGAGITFNHEGEFVEAGDEQQTEENQGNSMKIVRMNGFYKPSNLMGMSSSELSHALMNIPSCSGVSRGAHSSSNKENQADNHPNTMKPQRQMKHVIPSNPNAVFTARESQSKLEKKILNYNLEIVKTQLAVAKKQLEAEELKLEEKKKLKKRKRDGSLSE